MSVEILVSDMKAMLMFAGKKDIRDVCKSVQLYRGGLATTNGHMAAELRITGVDMESPAVLIPVSVVEQAVKLGGKADVMTIAWEGGVDEYGVTIYTGTISAGGATIPFEGARAMGFEFERFFPGLEYSGKAAQVNPHYMVTFEKAAEILADARKGSGLAAVFLHNGADNVVAVVVPDRSDFRGVVMPLRADVGNILEGMFGEVEN